ncbi:MAG: hypothetical protein JWR01_2701 [Subtercola sp.]|nr:hypothetical protein [Subtercola sp.]
MSGTPAGAVPPEPFAWLSRDKPAGRYKISLVTPRSEAVLGGFLLLAGIVFAVFLFSRGAGGAVALGVLLFVIFGGFGIVLLVMASARSRWARAYRQVHGHPPF